MVFKDFVLPFSALEHVFSVFNVLFFVVEVADWVYCVV